MATIEILADRIGIERAEFAGERVAARRIGDGAIAGGAHHIGKHIRGAQHRLQDFARRRKPSRAQMIEDTLEHMGEMDKFVEIEGAGAALDRMNRPEHRVHTVSGSLSPS